MNLSEFESSRYTTNERKCYPTKQGVNLGNLGPHVGVQDENINWVRKRFGHSVDHTSLSGLDFRA